MTTAYRSAAEAAEDGPPRIERIAATMLDQRRLHGRFALCLCVLPGPRRPRVVSFLNAAPSGAEASIRSTQAEPAGRRPTARATALCALVRHQPVEDRPAN